MTNEFKRRKQIWVDPSFEKFIKQHKLELKEITHSKKKVSDVEASRYIAKKYSFKL